MKNPRFLDDPVVAIRTDKLTKLYGRTVGVRDLSLEIQRGEIFGFLGPNGAGKTTTIRLVLGFLRPTSGTAAVFGMDSWGQRVETKQKLGYLPEGIALQGDVTGLGLLDYLGSFHRTDSTSLRKSLCERLGLGSGQLTRKVKTYSRGMRQKLGIVQALQHRPELLILDEPTEGLDPLVQHEFLSLLVEFKRDGGTVFLSSHILSEVDRVCDRVGIVRGGSLIEVQPVKELHRKKVRQMEITFAHEVEPSVFRLPGVIAWEQEGRRLLLKIKGDVDPVIKTLARFQIEDLVFDQARLEDIFLDYYHGEEGIS